MDAMSFHILEIMKFRDRFYHLGKATTDPTVHKRMLWKNKSMKKKKVPEREVSVCYITRRKQQFQIDYLLRLATRAVRKHFRLYTKNSISDWD